MWARQFAEKAGVVVPLQAAEHYYLITDPMPDVDPSWPVVEDPASYTYIRSRLFPLTALCLCPLFSSVFYSSSRFPLLLAVLLFVPYQR